MRTVEPHASDTLPTVAKHVEMNTCPAKRRLLAPERCDDINKLYVCCVVLFWNYMYIISKIES